MAEMAVRALRVICGTVMMPIADDAGGKNQQRDQRQREPDDSKCFPHSHSGKAERPRMLT